MAKIKLTGPVVGISGSMDEMVFATRNGQTIAYMKKKKKKGEPSEAEQKRDDTAKTPYQRVLERMDISVEAKARLAHLYVQLNPVELQRRIDQKIAQLWKISR